MWTALTGLPSSCLCFTTTPCCFISSLSLLFHWKHNRKQIIWFHYWVFVLFINYCFIGNSSILQSYMCGGKKWFVKLWTNKIQRLFKHKKKINKKMKTPFHTLSLQMFSLLLFTFNFWNCVIKFSMAQSIYLSGKWKAVNDAWISRTFQNLIKKSSTFQGLNLIQGLFKTTTKNSRIFQDCLNDAINDLISKETVQPNQWGSETLKMYQMSWVVRVKQLILQKILKGPLTALSFLFIIIIWIFQCTKIWYQRSR